MGFPFDVDSSTHCIIWVTREKAFLDCLKDGNRASTTSGSGASVEYRQWHIEGIGKVTPLMVSE